MTYNVFGGTLNLALPRTQTELGPLFNHENLNITQIHTVWVV